MKYEKYIVVVVSSLLLISGCLTQTEENPAIAYTKEKGISREIQESLKVLGENRALDTTEKSFIDRLAELPEELQRYVVESPALHDETIDTKELERLPSKVG